MKRRDPAREAVLAERKRTVLGLTALATRRIGIAQAAIHWALDELTDQWADADRRARKARRGKRRTRT